MSTFHFKQFDIDQNTDLMKVGTDAVLLGAWTKVKAEDNILEIGSGTGVISLMLAQKGGKTIEAIDIQKQAFELSRSNFNKSKWATKMTAHHYSLKKYCSQNKKKFDLIVSNPPYFESADLNLKPRNIAREQAQLDYKTLFQSTASLLKPKGRFSFIIPFAHYEKAKELMKVKGLFPQKICAIKGNKNAVKKRILVQSTFNDGAISPSNLTIEQKRNQYTKAYQKLLREYLTIF